MAAVSPTRASVTLNEPVHEVLDPKRNLRILRSKKTGHLFCVARYVWLKDQSYFPTIQKLGKDFYVVFREKGIKRIRDYRHGKEVFVDQEVIKVSFLFKEFQPFEKLEYSYLAAVLIEGIRLPITYFVFPKGIDGPCHLDASPFVKERQISIRGSPPITVSTKPFIPEIIDDEKEPDLTYSTLVK